jgi:hypothetical protein
LNEIHTIRAPCPAPLSGATALPPLSLIRYDYDLPDEQVQPGGVPVERVRARPVGLPVLLFGAVVQRVVVVLLLMQELLQLLRDDFDRIEHEILRQGDSPRGEYPAEGKLYW